METGYLHGHSTRKDGTKDSFWTQRVPVKMSVSWPNHGTWYALFKSRWRKVHLQVKRTFIVYQGERITIQIEGV